MKHIKNIIVGIVVISLGIIVLGFPVTMAHIYKNDGWLMVYVIGVLTPLFYQVGKDVVKYIKL